MAKKVILAVAGAGKTYYICNSLDEKKKNLILAFTHQNIRNIKAELIKKYGKIPELTTIMTFDSFLFSLIISPYEKSILKEFKKDYFVNDGVTIKSPPPKLINGKFNYRYKNKNTFEHYVLKTQWNSQYYCETLSELILYINEKSKNIFLKKICSKLNNFFDNIYIDEFQDFRIHDYDFLLSFSKFANNILLVGDFYQHSVAGKNNTGKPFCNNLDYDKYIELLKKEKFDVDITTLKETRRCPQVICNFIKTKMNIMIDANNSNIGKIEFVSDEKIISILNDDSIKKLVYEESSKYTFNSINWSYSKGDTYDNICVILTENLEELDNPDFNFNDVSPTTRNKFYVAVTRTRGNLYFLKQSLFKKVKNMYIH